MQLDSPTTLVPLSIDPTILVGLSLQMLGNPTGLLAPAAARLLTGLLVPWLEPPRMLHSFTSNLASSIASLLQVTLIIIIITISNVNITLAEVEAGHSSGDLSRRMNFVSRQTFNFFFIIMILLLRRTFFSLNFLVVKI